MRLMLATLLTAVLLGSATNSTVGDTPKEKYAEEQKKELQGAWVVTGTKGYSDETLKKELRELRLTFKGNSITAKYGEKAAEATYKLILTKAGPSQMDVTITQGPEAVKGKTFQGIYLLEGNTLKISYRDPGKTRPSTFTDEGEAGVYTVSFKKAKR